MPAVPDPNERGPEPSAGAGRRLHTRSLIVLGALLLLAVAAFAVTKRGADREASDERARAADQAVGAIRAQLAATRADVRGIVGVFSTARTIDDFAQFAQPALANPSLDAVSWAPRVTAPMRSAFERERGFAISEPAAGGIRTAAERAVYYPTTFVAPTAANARAIGVDLSADPAVADAVKAAIAGGTGRVTKPATEAAGGAVLLIEPAFQRGASLATPGERSDALTGIAIGTMQPAKLIAEALRGTNDLRVRITDGAAPVYRSATLPHDGVTRSLDAGGRTWLVTVESATSPGGQALPWVVLAAGLLTAILIALVAEQSSRRLAFAEDLVARRTVELREAVTLLHAANAEVVAAHAEAERKSQVDALTDTYNRGHLIELLKVELNRAERGDATAAVLLVDVDDFRWLNEEYGPTAGDIVLVEIAGRMKAMLRSYDSLGRFDGKRFAVLTPNVPSDEALFRVADALRQVVCSGPVLVEGRELWPTVSVGAARSSVANDPFELLAAADEALAAAHRRGRNITSIAGEAIGRDRAARAGRDPHRRGARQVRRRPRGHARAPQPPGRRPVRRGRHRPGPRRGGRAQRSSRRLAARRRQGRDPGVDPGEARAAGRGRVGDHAHPRRGRRGHRHPHRRPRTGRPGRPPPPRAVRRRRLPGRPGGRGHPAPGPHRGRRRRVLGDDRRSAVPPLARHRRRPPRAPPLRRDALRPRRGRGAVLRHRDR